MVLLIKLLCFVFDAGFLGFYGTFLEVFSLFQGFSSFGSGVVFFFL